MRYYLILRRGIGIGIGIGVIIGIGIGKGGFFGGLWVFCFFVVHFVCIPYLYIYSILSYPTIHSLCSTFFLIFFFLYMLSTN